MAVILFRIFLTLCVVLALSTQVIEAGKSRRYGSKAKEDCVRRCVTDCMARATDNHSEAIPTNPQRRSAKDVSE